MPQNSDNLGGRQISVAYLLDPYGKTGIVRPPTHELPGKRQMANRAIWSMRKRHEWLATPLKPKRVKRAVRLRCGLQDAIDRKGPAKTSTPESST